MSAKSNVPPSSYGGGGVALIVLLLVDLLTGPDLLLGAEFNSRMRQKSQRQATRRLTTVWDRRSGGRHDKRITDTALRSFAFMLQGLARPNREGPRAYQSA